MVYEHLSLPFLKIYLEKTKAFDVTKESFQPTGKIVDRILLKTGDVINRYNNETLQLQGNSQDLKDCLNHLDQELKKFKENPPKIFIAYAFKNRENKDRVQKLLKNWGFDVLVMEDHPENGLHLTEKLEATIYNAEYGIVLFSKDEKLAENGKFIPRSNVMIELGMLMATLKEQEKRFSILNYAPEDILIPSDILGLTYTLVEGLDDHTFEDKLMNEVYYLYKKHLDI